MKLIQTLAEEIEDELQGAKWYVKLAMEIKSDYPDVARTLYTISTQEMNHVKMLHDSVTAIIKSYREEHGEPPADMMAVYEYLHGKQIEKAGEVKILQALFNE